jgi:hypothetical protein
MGGLLVLLTSIESDDARLRELDGVIIPGVEECLVFKDWLVLSTELNPLLEVVQRGSKVSAGVLNLVDIFGEEGGECTASLTSMMSWDLGPRQSGRGRIIFFMLS